MRIPAILLALAALSASVLAQDRPAVSFEQLTIGATASGLSRSTVLPANKPSAAYCSGLVESGPIRIRVDGETATSTSGAIAEVGARVELSGGDSIRQFSAIRTTGASGGLGLTCYGVQPATWNGGLVVTPPQPGQSTSGTGAEVHAVSASLTTPSIAGGTLSSMFTGTSGTEGRWFIRDSFDQGYFVHENDMTAKSLLDTAVNIVHGSPLGLISYREEQAKTTSSWLVSSGRLDIKGDNTTTLEGVEIVFGGDGTVTTEGVIIAGTTGACFSASVTLTDISGTNQLLIGWRQNETWQDAALYTGYTRWNVVGVNNVDGSIVSQEEVAGATQTDDSGVDFADGQTRALKVCISAAGVPTAFYSANLSSPEQTGVTYNAITMTNSGLTQTAGTFMYPFLTFMTSGTDGPDPLINWVQIEPAP